MIALSNKELEKELRAERGREKEEEKKMIQLSEKDTIEAISVVPETAKKELPYSGGNKNDKKKKGDFAKEPPKVEVKPEPKVEVKQEPKVEVKQEPKVEVKEEPKVEVKQEPKVEVKEEPKVEVKQEPKVEVKQEPKVEVKQEPKVEVKQEPKVEVKQEPKVEVKEEIKVEEIKAEPIAPLPLEDIPIFDITAFDPLPEIKFPDFIPLPDDLSEFILPDGSKSVNIDSFDVKYETEEVLSFSGKETSALKSISSILNKKDSVENFGENTPKLTPIEDFGKAITPKTPVSPKITPVEEVASTTTPKITSIEEILNTKSPKVTPVEEVANTTTPKITPIEDFGKITSPVTPKITPVEDFGKIAPPVTPKITPVEDFGKIAAPVTPKITPVEDFGKITSPVTPKITPVEDFGKTLSPEITQINGIDNIDSAKEKVVPIVEVPDIKSLARLEEVFEFTLEDEPVLPKTKVFNSVVSQPVAENKVEVKVEPVATEVPKQEIKVLPPINVEEPKQEMKVLPPINVEEPKQEMKVLPPINVEVPKQEMRVLPPINVDVPKQEMKVLPSINVEEPKQEMKVLPPINVEEPKQEMKVLHPINVDVPKTEVKEEISAEEKNPKSEKTAIPQVRKGTQQNYSAHEDVFEVVLKSEEMDLEATGTEEDWEDIAASLFAPKNKIESAIEKKFEPIVFQKPAPSVSVQQQPQIREEINTPKKPKAVSTPEKPQLSREELFRLAELGRKVKEQESTAVAPEPEAEPEKEPEPVAEKLPVAEDIAIIPENIEISPQPPQGEKIEETIAEPEEEKLEGFAFNTDDDVILKGLDNIQNNASDFDIDVMIPGKAPEVIEDISDVISKMTEVAEKISESNEKIEPKQEQVEEEFTKEPEIIHDISEVIDKMSEVTESLADIKNENLDFLEPVSPQKIDIPADFSATSFDDLKKAPVTEKPVVNFSTPTADLPNLQIPPPNTAQPVYAQPSFVPPPVPAPMYDASGRLLVPTVNEFGQVVYVPAAQPAYVPPSYISPQAPYVPPVYAPNAYPQAPIPPTPPRSYSTPPQKTTFAQKVPRVPKPPRSSKVAPPVVKPPKPTPQQVNSPTSSTAQSTPAAPTGGINPMVMNMIKSKQKHEEEVKSVVDTPIITDLDDALGMFGVETKKAEEDLSLKDFKKYEIPSPSKQQPKVEISKPRTTDVQPQKMDKIDLAFQKKMAKIEAEKAKEAETKKKR
ncbi:MAG: hypothetical protein LBM93_15360 [Oscillospiraceae bacterium]|jgi:hypothetical protein|nr:hypothetical protein [Oscillospiraceae bacterium]